LALGYNIILVADEVNL